MGHFSYGDSYAHVELDDRVLMHLQITIVAKLRRGEHFLFRCGTADGSLDGETFWMSPSVTLKFAYDAVERPPINPAWLKALADAGNTNEGLWIVPEPHESVPLIRERRREPSRAAARR